MRKPRGHQTLLCVCVCAWHGWLLDGYVVKHQWQKWDVYPRLQALGPGLEWGMRPRNMLSSLSTRKKNTSIAMAGQKGTNNYREIRIQEDLFWFLDFVLVVPWIWSYFLLLDLIIFFLTSHVSSKFHFHIPAKCSWNMGYYCFLLLISLQTFLILWYPILSPEKRWTVHTFFGHCLWFRVPPGPSAPELAEWSDQRQFSPQRRVLKFHVLQWRDLRETDCWWGFNMVGWFKVDKGRGAPTGTASNHGIAV